MKIFRNSHWASEFSAIVQVGGTVSSIIKSGNISEYVISSVKTAPGKIISDEQFEIVQQLGKYTETRADDLFMGQMIVLLVTYLELMLQEYLEVIFVTYPIRMYDYLNSDKSLVGKVDLKEIINNDSREEIIMNLSKRAAANAASGKFETTLKQLENVSNRELTAIQRKNLLFLVTYRNKIVHEGFHSKDDQQHFLQGWVTVSHLLSTLIDWCKLNNLPHMT